MKRGPVLCPVDFSALSQRTLHLAVEMCRRTDSRLVLEHNLDSPPPAYLGVGWMWSSEHAAKDRDASEQAVERLQQLFTEIPEGIDYEAKITRGPVDEGILHVAGELEAAMIVIGTHGPSDRDHESVTERIILRAPCPVLTTGESYQPEKVFGAGEREPAEMSIVVPLDFTPRSLACARYALALARRMPHRFHLLHVASAAGREPARSEARIQRARERLTDLVPEDLVPRVSVGVVVGAPVEGILAAARAAEAIFILMPAHRKGAIRRTALGETTRGVLHGSDCPVWFLSPRARRALTV